MQRKTLRHYEGRGPVTRLAYTACYAAILAVGVGLIVAPTDVDPWVVHGLGVLIAGSVFLLAIRSIRWGTIDVRSDSVIVRGLLSTCRFRIPEIERFLVVRDVSSASDRSRVLAVRTTNGKTIVLDDFADVATDRGFSVGGLAANLNMDIREMVASSQRIGVA